MAKEGWIKTRHRVVRNIADVVFGPYCRWKYGITIDKHKEKRPRQYLILFNHQTAYDQFFVGLAFHQPIYYLASEDLFSKGWVSSLIRYAVAPIPIKKQTTDIAAVKTCIRVVREGGTLALAPEGNRTFSGRTGYMNPSVASLAKKLKLPVVLFRIEGGYGVHPRWSDVVRKGKMHAYVSRIIEREELDALSSEELFAVIKEGLYVDEAGDNGEFFHKNRAEYLERAMYVCPDCGLTTFVSEGHRITCQTCQKTVTYGTDTRLTGEDFDFPFPYVAQWYQYQEDYINSLDPGDYTERPVSRDVAQLSEVIVYKNKFLLRKEASLALYGDRIVVDEGKEDPLTLSFDRVSAVTILGKNKLNVYHDDRIYQLKSHKRFNGLKYVNLFHRYKNTKGDDRNGKFLGL